MIKSMIHERDGHIKFYGPIIIDPNVIYACNLGTDDMLKKLHVIIPHAVLYL